MFKKLPNSSNNDECCNPHSSIILIIGDHRITLVHGGIPLFADGKIVGAIGIGGGSKEQDMEIANFVVIKFNELMK